MAIAAEEPPARRARWCTSVTDKRMAACNSALQAEAKKRAALAGAALLLNVRLT